MQPCLAFFACMLGFKFMPLCLHSKHSYLLKHLPSPILLFETGSLTRSQGSLIGLCGLVCQPQGPACLHLPSTGITSRMLEVKLRPSCLCGKLLTELSHTSTCDRVSLFTLNLAGDTGQRCKKKVRLELMKGGT